MYNAVSGETVTYTYDTLNRLASASDSINQTVQWAERYTFDPFGNLTTKHVTGGSAPGLSVSVDNHNHITSVPSLNYDLNGNQNVGTYDAENRLITASGIQYAYDGQNKRIWAFGGGVDGLGNATGYTVNMYSVSGQKLGHMCSLRTLRTALGC